MATRTCGLLVKFWSILCLIAPFAWQGEASAQTSDLAEAARQIDEMYLFHRHEGGVTSKMKTFIDQQVKQQGEKYDLLWRMARLQWWLAEGESDKSRTAIIAKTGWDWGERAVKANPGGVEGNFWLAVNIGQYSLAIGVVRALANGIEGKFLAPLDRSIKINARYECAGPLRVKGNYHVSLPWPKRDVAQGIKLLTQALKSDPCGIRNHYYLAEAYEADGNVPAALAQVDIVLAAKPGGYDPADFPRLQGMARTLKARLKK